MSRHLFQSCRGINIPKLMKTKGTNGGKLSCGSVRPIALSENIKGEGVEIWNIQSKTGALK